MSWSPVLQSGFEPPVEVKSYLYTDPPIAGGWSENDVGPGTLRVVNDFARSGLQSMYSTALPGESYAAEIYRNPTVRGLLINAWLYYMPGTDFDRMIIWFENERQTLQWLRIRPKSYGVLEISGDWKLPNFPGATPPASIPTGRWFNLEAWLIMSSSETDGGVQTIQEAGVKLEGVEIYRITSGFPAIDNPTFGYMNTVEIGPWGVGRNQTDVWIDDVTIYQYVAVPLPQHSLGISSNPQSVPFNVRRVA